MDLTSGDPHVEGRPWCRVSEGGGQSRSARLSSSPVCPTGPGGEQPTHTAPLRLLESTSPLTIYPKKILFEANPLETSVCFATEVDQE